MAEKKSKKTIVPNEGFFVESGEPIKGENAVITSILTPQQQEKIALARKIIEDGQKKDMKSLNQKNNKNALTDWNEL
jgi:hypothetical protein